MCRRESDQLLTDEHKERCLGNQLLVQFLFHIQREQQIHFSENGKNPTPSVSAGTFGEANSAFQEYQTLEAAIYRPKIGFLDEFFEIQFD